MVRQAEQSSLVSKLHLPDVNLLSQPQGHHTPPLHHNHHELSKNYTASCLWLKESALFQVKHLKIIHPTLVFPLSQISGTSKDGLHPSYVFQMQVTLVHVIVLAKMFSRPPNCHGRPSAEECSRASCMHPAGIKIGT